MPVLPTNQQESCPFLLIRGEVIRLGCGICEGALGLLDLQLIVLELFVSELGMVLLIWCLCNLWKGAWASNL